MTRTRVIRIPGPIAQDKDSARAIRENRLLPALSRGERVIVDLSAVATATQSFLHASLSHAIRVHGEEVLDSVEFRGCQANVQNLIGTVVEYSLRARTLTQEGLSGTLRKTDVPQADGLDLVRQAVDVVASGLTSPLDIVAATGVSLRHVHYRLHAARILGLIRMGRAVAYATALGRTLANTRPGSLDENSVLRRAIAESPIMGKLAPGLLSPKPPSRRELVKRLRQKTGLAGPTAERRAQALFAWRKRLVAQQLTLPKIGDQE